MATMRAMLELRRAACRKQTGRPPTSLCRPRPPAMPALPSPDGAGQCEGCEAVCKRSHGPQVHPVFPVLNLRIVQWVRPAAAPGSVDCQGQGAQLGQPDQRWHSLPNLGTGAAVEREPAARRMRHLVALISQGTNRGTLAPPDMACTAHAVAAGTLYCRSGQPEVEVHLTSAAATPAGQPAAVPRGRPNRPAAPGRSGEWPLQRQPAASPAQSGPQAHETCPNPIAARLGK